MITDQQKLLSMIFSIFWTNSLIGWEFELQKMSQQRLFLFAAGLKWNNLLNIGYCWKLGEHESTNILS